jgi:hypothetical protein
MMMYFSALSVQLAALMAAVTSVSLLAAEFGKSTF